MIVYLKPQICKVFGCELIYKAKGFCRTHYSLALSNGVDEEGLPVRKNKPRVYDGGPSARRQRRIDYLLSKPYRELTKAERGSAGKMQLYPLLSERDRHLRHRYGLLEVEYINMLSQQNKCCAICEEEYHYDLYVDHDHTTGQIRGLLCAGCNTLVGYIETKRHLFQEVSTYLSQNLDRAILRQDLRQNLKNS